MFQNILVPLDGSKLAECALPYAEEMAKCAGNSAVVLVSVTERLSGQTSAPEIQAAYRSTDRTDLHGAGTKGYDNLWQERETSSKVSWQSDKEHSKPEGSPRGPRCSSVIPPKKLPLSRRITILT